MAVKTEDERFAAIKAALVAIHRSEAGRSAQEETEAFRTLLHIYTWLCLSAEIDGETIAEHPYGRTAQLVLRVAHEQGFDLPKAFAKRW